MPPSFLLFALVAFNDSVFNEDDAMCVFRDVMLVGNEDDGVAFGVQAIEERHDFVSRGGVEVASGFVGENDGRAIDQGAGDGDALALAA